VLNAPLLPFDWRQTTREFLATLDRYQAAAGNTFSLAPARAAVMALDEALARFYAHAPLDAAPDAEEARRFNAVQRRLARLLVPVNYSRATAFHHDPALEVPPLPDLAPALSLANAGNDVAKRGVITAHLMRGQNRLVWAVEQAKELATGY
jgi:N-acetylated-alpha-linked acidic dipeptidase